MRFSKFSPDTRRVIRNGIAVGGVSILPRVAQAVQSIVIAARFGAGDQVDAYLAALILPQTLLIIGAQSFATALVPAYLQRRTTDGEAAATELAARAFGFGIAGMAIATLGLWILGQPLISLTAHGFADAKRDTTWVYLLWLAPLVFCQGAVAIGTALINARDRFAWAALVPTVTPMLVIAILVLPFAGIDMRAVSIVTFVGALIEGAIVVLMARHIGLPWPRMTGKKGGGLGRLFGQNLFLAGSFIFNSGNPIIGQFFASHAPSGIAIMNYGSKVVVALLALAALPLATVVLPYFSAQTAQKDFVRLQRNLRHWGLVIVAVTVPATIVLIAASHPIVRILFEHGQFTAQDTDAVVDVQRAYLIQIPAYIFGTLGGRMMVALGLARQVFWVTIVNFVVNVGFGYILFQAMGVPGIALATSLMFIVQAILFLRILAVHLGEKAISVPDSEPARHG
ncbi:MAG TPA: lipid II flippase MurJ [Magnetospirillaceae bacterium]|jgi:putative peptidoglycan lipid II flippase